MVCWVPDEGAGAEPPCYCRSAVAERQFCIQPVPVQQWASLHVGVQCPFCCDWLWHCWNLSPCNSVALIARLVNLSFGIFFFAWPKIVLQFKKKNNSNIQLMQYWDGCASASHVWLIMQIYIAPPWKQTTVGPVLVAGGVFPTFSQFSTIKKMQKTCKRSFHLTSVAFVWRSPEPSVLAEMSCHCVLHTESGRNPMCDS